MTFISPLPTATAIREESRLRPDQVSATFTTGDLEDDIAFRIQEQCNIVEQRLSVKARPYAWPFSDAALESAYPRYTTDQRSAVTTRQMGNAILIVKMLTLASLYLTAGQLKVEYLERSEVYQARAETLLASLETEVEYMATHQTESTTTYSSTTLNTKSSKIPDDYYSEFAGYWYPLSWGGNYEN